MAIDEANGGRHAILQVLEPGNTQRYCLRSTIPVDRRGNRTGRSGARDYWSDYLVAQKPQSVTRQDTASCGRKNSETDSRLSDYMKSMMLLRLTAVIAGFLSVLHAQESF